jgi:hypothetical protein
MNQACKLLLLVGALIPVSVTAGPVQNVELSDGSRVRAEVISLDQGVYTLRSESLGKIRIPATRIRSISAGDVTSTAATAPTASENAQIDEVRRSLAQDPNIMGNIQTLQNDPLVKDVLNDEATMRAIQAGDLDTLMNDPKIKALLAHPTVRGITQGGR